MIRAGVMAAMIGKLFPLCPTRHHWDTSFNSAEQIERAKTQVWVFISTCDSDETLSWENKRNRACVSVARYQILQAFKVKVQ